MNIGKRLILRPQRERLFDCPISNRLVAALCTLPLLSTPTLAAPPSSFAPSVDACHTPASQIDNTVAALGKDGWTQLPAGEMPADIADLLIWPQIVFYTTGDTGGADLRSLADIQRKTVAGFARKKDIPQSKTRILTRDAAGQTEAALVLWQQPAPNVTQITCRFALSAHSMPGHPADGFGQPVVVDTSTPTLTRSSATTPQNSAYLSQQTGTAVTVTGTLSTHLMFRAAK